MSSSSSSYRLITRVDSRKSIFPVAPDEAPDHWDNETHYVGEENTLFFIDCEIDVSKATKVEVILQRPDGSKIMKIATPVTYNSSPDWISFRISSPDFNQTGKYKGQVSITIGSSSWSDPFYIKVEDPISSSSSTS